MTENYKLGYLKTIPLVNSENQFLDFSVHKSSFLHICSQRIMLLAFPAIGEQNWFILYPKHH